MHHTHSNGDYEQLASPRREWTEKTFERQRKLTVKLELCQQPNDED
jgi:hypothetical protein